MAIVVKPVEASQVRMLQKKLEEGARLGVDQTEGRSSNA